MKRMWPKPESESFVAWSDRLEKHIRRWILILVLLLVATQAAMQSPFVRSWLSPTERAEGILYDRDSG